MKYFILDQVGQSIAIDSYLKKSGRDHEFERFIRREARHEVLPEANSDSSQYLAVASRLGFNWEQNSDIGHVQYDYKANLMKRLVEKYARQLVGELEFPVYEIGGSNMFNLRHPVVEAYASLYGDRLYLLRSGKSEIVMSYDASYPQFNLAAGAQISHRQLPFAHFSLSDCYRREQSGEVMMLYRQRRFYMPDIHPYFRDAQQAFEWFPEMQAKILAGGKAANRCYQVMIEVPSDAVYKQYEPYIRQIPKWLGADVLVNILNDGKDRYWVVNVDYKIIDALGQSREIGCIQVDVGNAPRLGIEYVDEDCRRRNPVIIHSAIPGGIERYLYIMLDNFDSGLPDWIQPVHARLLPVNAEYVAVCQRLVADLSNRPLRLEIDDRSASVSSKLKLAHENLIPRQIVIGPKEADEDFVKLRRLSEELVKNIGGLPFVERGWPAEISKQL